MPGEEELAIGGGLNGHVGVATDGFEDVHGGRGYGDRNEEGQAILEFAAAKELAVVNTWFQKREQHLVTYESGGRRTQIDYFLTRKHKRKDVLNCKVVPSDSELTQHRPLIMDVKIGTPAQEPSR